MDLNFIIMVLPAGLEPALQASGAWAFNPLGYGSKLLQHFMGRADDIVRVGAEQVPVWVVGVLTLSQIATTEPLRVVVYPERSSDTMLLRLGSCRIDSHNPIGVVIILTRRTPDNPNFFHTLVFMEPRMRIERIFLLYQSSVLPLN